MPPISAKTKLAVVKCINADILIKSVNAVSVMRMHEITHTITQHRIPKVFIYSYKPPLNPNQMDLQ